VAQVKEGGAEKPLHKLSHEDYTSVTQRHKSDKKPDHGL
jgi:hypothetical protein